MEQMAIPIPLPSMAAHSFRVPKNTYASQSGTNLLLPSTHRQLDLSTIDQIALPSTDSTLGTGSDPGEQPGHRSTDPKILKLTNQITTLQDRIIMQKTLLDQNLDRLRQYYAVTVTISPSAGMSIGPSCADSPDMLIIKHSLPSSCVPTTIRTPATSDVSPTGTASNIEHKSRPEFEDREDSNNDIDNGDHDDLLIQKAHSIVKTHIALLHTYNEIKDIGMGLLGLVADRDGKRLCQVLEERGVDSTI